MKPPLFRTVKFIIYNNSQLAELTSQDIPIFLQFTCIFYFSKDHSSSLRPCRYIYKKVMDAFFACDRFTFPNICVPLHANVLLHAVQNARKCAAACKTIVCCCMRVNSASASSSWCTPPSLYNFCCSSRWKSTKKSTTKFKNRAK